MQSLDPTGTRLLLLIKGITQTGPNVPAESGGWPLFTSSEGRFCEGGNTCVSLPSILSLAAAKAICNTRFPPSVKLGSDVRRSPRHRPRPRPDFPLWVCKKKKKKNSEETSRCSDLTLLMCGNSGVFSGRPGMRPGPGLGVFLFG